MLFYRNILSQNLFTNLPWCFNIIFCYKTCLPTYHAVLSYHFATKFAQQPTMLFYRNILSQNLFTNLPYCFNVTFCDKICSATYHPVLSKHFVTKFVHLPTSHFYRNILSQNLVFSYHPCCFIITFCHKICSPTYHTVLT